MNLSDLEILGKSCINEPWGLGDPFLQSSESAPPYYRFLHKYVKEYKPAVVVECGVYMGVATVHMALGNPDTVVIGIDPAPHSKAYSAQLLYDNIYLMIGYSCEPWLVADISNKYGGKIGVLFLDSIHDGETPRKEYEAYNSMFSDVCLVVCDDIKANKRMEEFWAWLPGDKMEMNFLHPSQYPGYIEPGFGISIVKKHYGS